MVTREEVTVEKINIEHKFYCDGCNKLLGTSVEFDDGWYPDFGRYDVCFNLPLDTDHSGFGKSDRYTLHKNFCEDCLKNFTQKVQDALVNLGFEINQNDY